MSFLTVLKGFGGWFAKSWQKLFNAAPTIEHVADTVITYAAPALQIILGAVGAGPEAAVVQAVITEIQKDLHVASGLIYDFGANPNASSILSAAVKDLQGLLDAGHIKDQALQGKVTLVINTVSSLVSSLDASLQPATA